MQLTLPIFALAISAAAASTLTISDKFSILEQLNQHQAYIDNNGSCHNAHLYASLYWPEASFRAIDPNRDGTATGHVQIRGAFDYDHSVFPLYMWRHSVGAWEISDTTSAPSGEQRAAVYWKWRVDWQANTTGVVSTGTYNDVFEKRGDMWKVLSRISRDDPNWPLYLFAPYSANAESLFHSSCGDTTLP
jgi:hypothetical protein